MARKKKSEQQIIDEVSTLVAEVTLQETEDVKVTKGSHLTVYTYPDGRTKLEWDDEALMRDVQEAIAEYEASNMKPAVKAKAVTRKAKVKNGK